jgi:lipid A 3-O-deacylase
MRNGINMKFRILAAVAVALSGASAPQANAADNLIHELRGGILAHDQGFWGAGHVEKGLSGNLEVALGPSLELWGGQIRPAIGGTYSGPNNTSYAYADARWEFTPGPLFFSLGIGGAVHDGPLHGEAGRKNLGSRVLFHVPLEAGVQITPANRVSLYFEHVSNGWLADPNPGMDNVGVRLAHRF